MAPLLPGLSDSPEQLARVIEAARAAGACGIWANLLYLKPGTREHFLNCLARDWPELLPDYERLYAGRAYLPASVTAPARDEVRRLARVHGIRDRRTEPLRPPERDEQLSLLSA
jgi:DNA repair photolyase